MKDIERRDLGALAAAVRNNTKIPRNIIEARTGITPERLALIERGVGEPATLQEIHSLSDVFGKDMRVLLPATNDMDSDGVHVMPFRQALTRDEFRGGADRLYTYKHLAASTIVPDVDAVWLELHEHDKQSAIRQMNNGHLEAQLTVVAEGGPVGVIGKHNGQVYTRILEEPDDSVEILSGTPHGFWSPSKEKGKIVAVTHAHSITYQVREQMRVMGIDAVLKLLASKPPIQDSDISNGMKFLLAKDADRVQRGSHTDRELARTKHYPNFQPSVIEVAQTPDIHWQEANIRHKWGAVLAGSGVHLHTKYRGNQGTRKLATGDSFVLHGGADYGLTSDTDQSNRVLLVDLPGPGGQLESSAVLKELQLIEQTIGQHTIHRFLSDGDYNAVKKK